MYFRELEIFERLRKYLPTNYIYVKVINSTGFAASELSVNCKLWQNIHFLMTVSLIVVVMLESPYEAFLTYRGVNSMMFLPLCLPDIKSHRST